MALIGFTAFKTRKPREFNYKPRYYDPIAEEREQRRKEVLGEEAEQVQEEADGQYHPGQYVRELRIRRGIVADRQRSKSKSGIIRLALFIAMAVGLLWFIFH